MKISSKIKILFTTIRMLIDIFFIYQSNHLLHWRDKLKEKTWLWFLFSKRTNWTVTQQLCGYCEDQAPMFVNTSNYSSQRALCCQSSAVFPLFEVWARLMGVTGPDNNTGPNKECRLGLGAGDCSPLNTVQLVPPPPPRIHHQHRTPEACLVCFLNHYLLIL